MIINPYIYSVGTAYDPDAQLFFNAETAAGVTLTTTQMNAVNQWVLDSKAANIWTKFKAVYPMVGGSPTSHKFNLKNPLDTNAAFRLVFSGGGTHSSNGYQPNGTNGYADTFLSPSVMAQNSIHGSVYSRTDANALYCDFGANTGTNGFDLLIRYVGNSLIYVNSTTNAQVNRTTSLGFYQVNRVINTHQKLFANGTSIINAALNSVTPSTFSISIGAENFAGTNYSYSNRQYAFASFGDGLTDLESQLFYQITEKYQVALSRNVNTTQSFYYNSAYNNETNAFLFSTQITDNTIQTATNTLVTDLKTAGVFTKMKALYPMVGGTATTCKFNLVNPQDTDAAFRLTFTGGGTFSSNGYLPNGVNAYANTWFMCSVNSTASNISAGVYLRTNNITASYQFGGLSNAGEGLALAVKYTDNNTYFAANNYLLNGVGNYVTDTRGLFIVNKFGPTTTKIYKNGLAIATANPTTANVAQPAYVFIGARAIIPSIIDGYDNKENAFSFIGNTLTDAEALAFYNAVQLFQTTLGRQV